VFIERSIDAVFSTIWEAVLLVAAVCLFFLRNWRAMLVPLVTIPVSLVGAFTLMLVFGFSINTLTLLALVLAIGLVVDDAIVVLENIYRHIEEGMEPSPPLQGREGDRLRGGGDDDHAGRGVCAGGLHDRAHRQAVHRVRAHARRRGDRVRLRRADAVADDVLEAAAPRAEARPDLQRHRALPVLAHRGYRGVLRSALSARWLVMLVFAVVAGSSVWLMGQLKNELAPLEDRGR
jgi:multidrug efflux pump